MHSNSANPGAGTPASLTSPVLARRLADLCGEERNVLVDFLLHLDEFDERRAWAEAGYGSLWAYCLEVLHLREGAAWRRIEAMKLLRRFPSAERALRDGRLCLTTFNLLGPVLGDENVSDLVARAAFLSKADTERLVVSIRPRVAPRDGIRRVTTGAAPAATERPSEPAAAACSVAGALAPTRATADEAPASLSLAEPPPAPVARPDLRPVSEDTYSLRVTIDAACKAELDQLVSLLSHKTGGDLAAVLREAIRCGILRHGKRRGAVEPERRRRRAGTDRKAPDRAAAGEVGSSSPSSPRQVDPRAIPMEVKREVMKRDGGRCAWTSPDGKRCGSTWRLEFGHIVPVAAGGQPTADNIRVECGVHNGFEADRYFGREHMAQFRGRADFRQWK